MCVFMSLFMSVRVLLSVLVCVLACVRLSVRVCAFAPVRVCLSSPPAPSLPFCPLYLSDGQVEIHGSPGIFDRVVAALPLNGAT